MKNIFVAIVCCLLFPVLRAQEMSEKSLNDELYVITDRELYITGETVYMKVFSRTGDHPGSVLYSDVSDRYNNPSVQVKSTFEGTTGKASFRIPDTLATGIYYIRVFGSWMKNPSLSGFSYKRIAVVNPYGDFTLIKKGESGVPLLTGDNEKKVFSLSLVATPLNPAKREKVKLELLIKDDQGNPLEGEFSLSVAKRTSKLPVHTDKLSDQQPGSGDYANAGNGGYSISGTIWDRSTGKPLAHENLSMGIAGKSARCVFTVSDENGEFSFRTDIRGKNILVIQPLDPAKTDYIIELRDPFPPHSALFQPEPLQMDSSLSAKIDNAIIAAQVARIYSSGIVKTEKNESSRDFFGQPERSVILSGYIELSSLQEVIRELVPGVMVVKKDGRETFRIINKYPTGQFTTSPLVIFDGIPVYDISQLLRFRPAELEKIDIINTRYYYGVNVFEGIISIVSRKGDLKLYEFPEAVFRQEHEFIQEYDTPVFPDYSSEKSKKSRIPDTRNTLMWDPEIRTDRKGSATVEFFTGDEPGEYEISIDGFSLNGIHVKSSSTFIVEP